VPETRLELVSPCERRILSPLRIPFRHSGGGGIAEPRSRSPHRQGVLVVSGARARTIGGRGPRRRLALPIGVPISLMRASNGTAPDGGRPPLRSERRHMAHSSSPKSNQNLRKVDAPVPDGRWKTSPSTEVTSDKGVNARRARERRHAENDPQNARSKVDANRGRGVQSDPLPRSDRRK
jgi:hypothetical protein